MAMLFLMVGIMIIILKFLILNNSLCLERSERNRNIKMKVNKAFVDNIKMSKIMRKRFIIFLVFFFLTIACGMYYYSCLITFERRFSSDDAGWIIALYSQQGLGLGKTLKNYFSLFYLLKLCEYNILGVSEYTGFIDYVIQYMLAIIPAMYLALERNEGICWKGLPLFLFMVGITGNSVEPVIKYHTAPAIIALYLLLFYQYKKKYNIGKKKSCIVLLFGLMQGVLISDFLLTICNIIIPLFVYFIISEYFNNKYRKYYSIIFWLLLIVLLFLWRVYPENILRIYGSYTFPNLDIICLNLKYLIEGGLLMFNIPIIKEPILQFSTILWGTRLAVVSVAVIILIKDLVCFIKKGSKKGDEIDILLSLIFASTFLCFVFTIHPGEEESVRYASILYYIIPIAICRKISQGSDKTVYDKCGYYVPVFFSLCIIMYMSPLNFEKRHMSQDELTEIILKDNRFEWGIGEYWNSQVIDVLSRNQKRVQPWSASNNSVAIVGYPEYISGYSKYNFWVEDFLSDNGLERKETIMRYLGIPKEIIQVEDSEIYLFDYDIRTKPIYYDNVSNMQDIVCSNGVNITEEGFELEKNAYLEIEKLLAYTGKERIDILGRGVDNIEIFIDKENGDEIVLETSKLTDAEYQIMLNAIGHYPDITVRIQNNGQEQIFIQQIVVKRISNAIPIDIDGNKAVTIIGKGNYNVSFLAENLKGEMPSFYIDGKDISYDVVSKGKQRIVCHISSDRNGQLEIIWKNLPNEIKAYIETPYTEIQNYW